MHVHVAVLLCVFLNDNDEKVPVKQITNWTAFGEIQTATVTFIACSVRFRLISRPFENVHSIPRGPWGFITLLIPMGMFSSSHQYSDDVAPAVDFRPALWLLEAQFASCPDTASAFSAAACPLSVSR